MSYENLTISVVQGNYDEQCNVTIWSDQCRLFLMRELIHLSRKIQYSELKVVSIVRETVRKYFTKNLLFLLILLV